jgi:hypothetical protein
VLTSNQMDRAAQFARALLALVTIAALLCSIADTSDSGLVWAVLVPLLILFALVEESLLISRLEVAFERPGCRATRVPRGPPSQS